MQTEAHACAWSRDHFFKGTGGKIDSILNGVVFWASTICTGGQDILLASQRETNVLGEIPGGREGITGNLHLCGRTWLKQDMRMGSRVAPSHSRSFLGQGSVWK